MKVWKRIKEAATHFTDNGPACPKCKVQGCYGYAEKKSKRGRWEFVCFACHRVGEVECHTPDPGAIDIRQCHEVAENAPALN